MEIAPKQHDGGGNADCSRQEAQMLLIRQALEEQWQADKNRKVECFRRLNKYVRPGQILFAGSSLMEQFPVTEFAGELSLPLRVYNRGIGGFTTLELLEAMDACIYGVRPAFLYLNIGTNDLNDPQLTTIGTNRERRVK